MPNQKHDCNTFVQIFFRGCGCDGIVDDIRCRLKQRKEWDMSKLNDAKYAAEESFDQAAQEEK